VPLKLNIFNSVYLNNSYCRQTIKRFSAINNTSSSSSSNHSAELYPGGLNGIKSLLAGASLQLGSRPAVTGADIQALSRGYNEFLEKIGSEDTRNQVKLCRQLRLI
jgi:hypothetical protein